MPVLRDYQVKAIAMLRERHRDRPCLVVGTGAGKTTIASEIIRAHVERSGRALFLVHRRELVDQAFDRLAQHGVKAGRIIAGHDEDRALPVQVASIQSLARRAHWPASLVIIDEAHHAVAETYRAMLDRYAGSIILGMTATPLRLDGKGLGDMFGCLIEPVTTAALVEQGYLVAPKVFAPPIDLKGIRTQAGDYSLPELVERVSPLIGSITETWFQRANGMRTVAFACSIEHSKEIVAAFQAKGVSAAHLDGTMARDERKAVLDALRSGAITLMSSCSIVSEGFDLPALQCAIQARPTKSLAMHRQQIGRIMRPPGPVIVLDHAGNHHEHGMVTDPVTWSLDGKPKKERATPTRQCSECFAIYDASLPACPECGAVPEVNENVVAPGVENEGELEEFKSTEQRAEFYRELVIEASRRWYAVGWARARYQAKFGVWPRFQGIEDAEYNCREHKPVLAVYGPRRVMRCAKCCRSEAVSA